MTVLVQRPSRAVPPEGNGGSGARRGAAPPLEGIEPVAPDVQNRSLSGLGPRANVSLKQLWAFLSVAETGSFTASAAALCTTQSAVSR